MNKLYIIILLFCRVCIIHANNKEADIQIYEPTHSNLSPLRNEMYIFGTWGYNDYKYLYTANNHSTLKERSVPYLTFYELGIGIDTYKDRGFIVEGNLGYAYGSLAYSKSPFVKSRVQSHWLTFDTNITNVYMLNGMLFLGLKSSFFLNSSIKNTDNYALEGLYNDCFNSVTFTPYLGIKYKLQNFKLEGRAGWHVIPYLDADKIAYHNMYKTSVSGFFIEFKLSLRVFTTSYPSRPINSVLPNNE